MSASAARTDRVLVTGGAGFIGSHVCEQLIREGREVVVIDNLSTGHKSNLTGLDVKFVEGSVAELKAVEEAMAGCNKVVHLAALPSVARSLERPLDTHEACATGTVNVLQVASQKRARVIYAGSSSAYGNQRELHKHEGLREDPRSPYAAAKMAGELYCRTFAHAFGLHVVVTRFFNVFGPRQPADSPYSGVIASFCRNLILGQPVRIDGDGQQGRDFTYVDDVVVGLLQCLDADTKGCETVNLAYGSSTTVIELYERLCEYTLRHTGDMVIPDPERHPPRTGDVGHSLANISKARDRFGFAPTVGFVDGLARTYAWYHSQLGSE
ncbi:NAD-dependent epimerase/dehydratase family protein [bacterium]|nr:NAD-dependent epimerase/dehydratase family protein [bacterium]